MKQCNGKKVNERPCPRESLVDLALQGGAPSAPDGFARPADDGLGDVGPLVAVRLVPRDELAVLLAQWTDGATVIATTRVSLPFRSSQNVCVFARVTRIGAERSSHFFTHVMGNSTIPSSKIVRLRDCAHVRVVRVRVKLLFTFYFFFFFFFFVFL